MKRASALALVVLTTLALLAPASPAAPKRYLNEVFSSVTVKHDIVYGQATNDTGALQQLTLDLYEPTGDTSTKRPVFVWAHGGSLVFGDKGNDMEKEIATAFAKRGWVVASINYRLMSVLIQPDCIHDIICALNPRLPIALYEAKNDMQAAVRWFRVHEERLRIAPDEITVGGHSAGAGVALYTNFGSEEVGNSGNPGVSSKVAGAMTNSGSMLEPSSVGAGEPPIVMFNSLTDTDFTLPVGFVSACLTTTLMQNTCEFNGFAQGGHSLFVHRPEIIQRSAEFFCRRVIAGCTVPPPAGTQHVGPTGSTWGTQVVCGKASDNFIQNPVAGYSGARGVELCSDGGLGPVQGRVYIDTDTSGQVYLPKNIEVDGDADNPFFSGAIHMPAHPNDYVNVVTTIVELAGETLGIPLPI